MITTKEPVIQKTNKEIARSMMVRAKDTKAGGGHQSTPRGLGKTWVYQFKRANRPKPKVQNEENQK